MWGGGDLKTSLLHTHAHTRAHTHTHTPLPHTRTRTRAPCVQVNLFNYPVVVEHAPALRYGGHSSHVMNVKWSADESYAVSVGGRDRCVFQWRLVRAQAPPTTFYGNAPCAPIDKAGIVYRLQDGVPQQAQQPQQQRLQQPQQAQQQWAFARPPPGGPVPVVAQGGMPGKHPLGGGGHGMGR